MTGRALVVDGANVVGSRPDGWWRDRAGAAARLHARLLAVPALASTYDGVVLVLEGRARAGVPEATGDPSGVRTVHAPADGDSTIVAVTRDLVARGLLVEVATADLALGDRVRALGATILRPGRLLDLLDEAGSHAAG